MEKIKCSPLNTLGHHKKSRNPMTKIPVTSINQRRKKRVTLLVIKTEETMTEVSKKYLKNEGAPIYQRQEKRQLRSSHIDKLKN